MFEVRELDSIEEGAERLSSSLIVIRLCYHKDLCPVKSGKVQGNFPSWKEHEECYIFSVLCTSTR